MRRLWIVLASTQLCFWTLNLLCLNLVIGGIYTNFDRRYRELDSELFLSWMTANFDVHCWWLISLMLVLTVLGANTLACSGQRLCQLWQRRKKHRLSTDLLLLCPTLMHLCFLLILSGHALTEFSGAKDSIPVLPGRQYDVAGTRIQVLDAVNQFRSEGPLKGYLQQSRADLKLTRNGRSHDVTIQVLQPLFDAGVTYHLALAGKADKGREPRLVINVKRDTGLPLILLGNGLMCLLLCFYFFFVRKQSRGDNL